MLSFFRRPQRDAATAVAATADATLPRSRREAAPRATPLDATGLVGYSWLLDPKKQIVGYHMHWRPRADHQDQRAATRVKALVDAIASGFVDRHKGWAMGRVGVMLDVTPEAMSAVEWRGLPPKNVVLCWKSEDLAKEGTLPLLKALRADGFGHLLSGELPEDKELCELVTHFDVGSGEPAGVVTARAVNRRGAHPVATRMHDWAQFDACAARRIPVLVEPITQGPPSAPSQQQLEPETMLIIRLLQMVQRNADVRDIEAALKHDAALTYRLLRHINSPTVGAGVEIESLRHAVAMLGYARLFRWLSLLLTTTDMKYRPAFLTKKAIIRGRFVELLGQSLLGADHADNLFLVGMFSIMDQLVGLPMADLMERVQLADAVRCAIMQQEGAYAPLLKLAVACEGADPEGDRLIDDLLISASQVNAAHLGAIAWAQEIAGAEY